MRIAVCDDDRCFANDWLPLLDRIKQQTDSVAFFSSGLDLLDSAAEGYPYDVTFLDIRMPGLNGLDVAHEIRSMAPSTVIILLTNYPEYALDAYAVRPFDYLLKPVSAGHLSNLLIEARQMVCADETLTFALGREIISLPLNVIRYLESQKWQTRIHCGNHDYHINRRLKDLYEEVEPRGFVRVHQSFVVNAAYIRSLDRGARILTLAEGNRIPVSRQRLTEVAAWFMRQRTGGL